MKRACLILSFFLLIARSAVGDSDLSVQISDSPDPATLGMSLTYSITVSNAGPEAAKDLMLSDSLPTSMTFESVTGPDQWSCTTPQVGVTGVISCTNVSLDVSEASTIVIVVKPISTGVLVNTASLTSSSPDPNESNNQISEETAVITGAGPNGRYL